MTIQTESGRPVAQLVEAPREVPGSIPGQVFGKFQVAQSLCPHSVALGSTQPVIEMSTCTFVVSAKENTFRVTGIKSSPLVKHQITPFWLGANLSPRRPKLCPRPVHVGFVVGKVALEYFLLRVLQIFPVSMIPPMLTTHSFIYHRLYVILATDSVLKQVTFLCLTPFETVD
jgi:hypothetical protein